MANFDNIPLYNAQLLKELDTAIKDIKPYLIQTFTIFYGKKYQDIIVKTINDVHFTYFLSEKSFRQLKESKRIKRIDMAIINYYLKYFKYLDHQFHQVKSREELEANAYTSLILKSDFDLETLSSINFLDYLELDTPLCFATLLPADNSIQTFIFLPVFAISLETIIHEINHSLMFDIVGITEDDLIIPNLFDNDECEELFNIYLTKEILKRYNEEKYPIPSILKKFSFVNQYDKYLYLIEVFYYGFKEIIKHSIMSKNFNLLRYYAGNEDYKLFCSLIQKYCLYGDCSQAEFEKLIKLIIKMNNHAINLTPITDAEYLHILEEEGLSLRRLK